MNPEQKKFVDDWRETIDGLGLWSRIHAKGILLWNETQWINVASTFELTNQSHPGSNEDQKPKRPGEVWVFDFELEVDQIESIVKSFESGVFPPTFVPDLGAPVVLNVGTQLSPAGPGQWESPSQGATAWQSWPRFCLDFWSGPLRQADPAGLPRVEKIDNRIRNKTGWTLPRLAIDLGISPVGDQIGAIWNAPTKVKLIAPVHLKISAPALRDEKVNCTLDIDDGLPRKRVTIVSQPSTGRGVSVQPPENEPSPMSMLLGPGDLGSRITVSIDDITIQTEALSSDLSEDLPSPAPPPTPNTEAFGQWLRVRDLASGGGGKVVLCIKETAFNAFQGTDTLSNEAKRGQVSALIDTLLGSDGVTAVKVPKFLDETSRKRFRKEIDSMREVNHPASIRLIDADPNAEPTWFAMEYHPRGALSAPANRSIFRARPMAILAALRPIVEVLASIHEGKTIHRDVKPGNIFVADDGRLILGDYGVALRDSPDETRLTENSPAHSRDWVPDWVQFDRDKYTPAVDVFAAVKVMQFLLSGTNVMASGLQERIRDLREGIGTAAGAEQLFQLFEKCIVPTDETMSITNGSSLLAEIDRILLSRTDSRRGNLICSYLSQGMSFEQLGDTLRPVLGFTSLPILVSNPLKRLEVQVRAFGKGNCRFQVKIGTQSSQPCSLNSLSANSPGVWRETAPLTFPVDIPPGWHDITFTGVGVGGISGFVFYEG